MANEEAKEKDKILSGIDQRMVNQRGFSRMVIEVISPKIIKVNKGASDVAKRDTSKETAWQKISICITRKKRMKM